MTGVELSRRAGALVNLISFKTAAETLRDGILSAIDNAEGWDDLPKEVRDQILYFEKHPREVPGL